MHDSRTATYGRLTLLQITMNNKLHKHLNEAIQKWVDFTGVDPQSQSWDMGDYEIKKTYDEIQEAQELDESGITTAMLIHSFADWLCRNVNFSLHSLYHHPENALDDLDKLKALLDSLESDPIKDAVSAFQSKLKEAAQFYDVDEEPVNELIDDTLSLAFIRRDAVKAIDKLSAYQFTRGSFSEKTSFQYNPNIVQFWNINSLLDMMASQPMPGVTLCLIRDSKEALFSYFAFAFRDGENIIILTDKQHEAYPGQNEKRRRPDKLFEKRAFQYRFPYQILEYDVVNDKYIRVPDQKGLIERNTKAVPLGDFSDLQPDQILWLIMMLDLFRSRFWENKKQLPEISYTGEMVEKPKILHEAMENLPAKTNEKIQMPWFTSESVNSENVSGDWERDPTEKNHWMERRYEDQVNDDLLNIRGPEDEVTKLIEEKTDGENKFPKHLSKYQRNCKTLDPRSFGTEKELREDAEWIARYNKACQINKAAHLEYTEKKDEIIEWFEKSVRDNDQFILRACARMELMADKQVRDKAFTWKTERSNILEIKYNDRAYMPDYWISWGKGKVKLCDTNEEDTKYRCYVSGSKASVFCRIEPSTPQSVATLSGCDVDELPIFLQHYWKRNQYSGNSILDRLDPMEYVVKNPWIEDLRLSVYVSLGKRAFNNLRKKEGLERFHDWDNLKVE